MKIKNLIEKVKRTVAGFMATIICLALLPAINVKAEISSNIFTYGNYDIEYNIVNEWDGYQNIEIKLTNIGSDPIYNWALGYNAGGEITNTWNCTVYSSNGTDYIIKNSGYNYEVMPEASITFGYTLMGSNLTIPSAFENCAERIEISDKYDAQLIITDKWDIGFTGYIDITNMSDIPLEAWMLSFDTNFTVDNFWNANVVENSEYSYTASSQIMSNPIQPQTSVQVGISASFESGIEPMLSNIVMSAIQIKNNVVNSGNNNDNIIDDSDDTVGKIYFKELSSEDDLIYDSDGNCYFKNQVLLTAYDGVSFETVSALADSMNARIVGYIELTNDYQIEFNYDMSVDKLFNIVNELSANFIVEFIMPNVVFEAVCDSLPNDEEIQPEGSVKIHGSNWHLYAINAPDAWEYYTNQNLGVSTSTVKIGVIDNFFYTAHDDLHFTKTWNNPQVADNNHGTLVAGIIGADFNNTEGIAGICPKSELYGYSYYGENEPSIITKSQVMKIKYILALLIGNNVKVINVSMGLFCDDGLSTASIEIFLNKLLNMGYNFVIVNSAGNDGKADAKKNSYFSNIDESSPVYNNIIVVGAVVHQSEIEIDPITHLPTTSTPQPKKDENSNFTLECEYKNDSNYGDRVDIVAPGAGIYSTSIDSKTSYYVIGSTSAAAPHVSGVAGMIYSIKPDLKGSEVKSIIINSAKESANKDPKRKIICDKGPGYEYALLDAKAAVDMAVNLNGPFIPNLESDKAIVFGTVTDENDNPISHAKIRVTSKNTSCKIEDETDDEGNYLLTLPLDTYDIKFYIGEESTWFNWLPKDDYKYHTIKNKVIERENDGTIQAYPLNIKLDNKQINSIRILDSNGKDLFDVSVVLTNSDSGDTYSTTVNSDDFIYGDVVDGKYVIEASKDGYIPKTYNVKARDGLIYNENDTLLNEVLLTPIEITVKGKVEEYNRTTKVTKPAANHTVVIYSEEHPDSVIAKGITNADGEYEIKFNKQGDFVVWFSNEKQSKFYAYNGEYIFDVCFETEDNEDKDTNDSNINDNNDWEKNDDLGSEISDININFDGTDNTSYTGDYSGNLSNGIWLTTSNGKDNYYVRIYTTSDSGEFKSTFGSPGWGLYTSTFHHWSHELKMATYRSDGKLINDTKLDYFYDKVYIGLYGSTPLMKIDSINSVTINSTGIDYNMYTDGYYKEVTNFIGSLGVREEKWEKNVTKSRCFYNNSKCIGASSQKPF